jgi:thioredoxin reductase (NADPH)
LIVFFVMEIYDLLVLGAGPAGMAAAIYAGRYDLKTLVVGKSIGGTANLAGELENWPGFVGPGIELMKTIREQAEKFGAEFLEDEVKGVEKDGDSFILKIDEKEFRGKSLIVALGTEHRQLNIPGEKEFLGKGVSYCATCDGNFFRGKNVVVVGGADSAAKAALYLSGICEKVYVVYRKHEMRCEPVSLSKICETENIEIIYYSNPVEVVGDGAVKGLKIVTEGDNGKSESVLDVDGVFIEVGAAPAAEVVENLGLEMDGDYIVTNKEAKTNVDGVFAAGDVTNNFLKQMVTAAGEGAVAAKAAHEFLMG